MQIYNIYVFLLQLKGHDRYLKTSRTYFIFQGHFKDFKDLWQPCISFLCLTALVCNFTKVAGVQPIIGFHNIRRYANL